MGLAGTSEFPSFDLETIPFSRAGSFYKIVKTGKGGFGELSIETSLRGAITHRWDPDPAWANNFFKIRLYQGGGQVNYRTHVTPWELILLPESGKGKVKITFSGVQRFVFETSDVELHLVAYKNPKGLFINPNGEVGFVLYHGQATAQLKAFGKERITVKDEKHFVLKDRKRNVMVLWLPHHEQKWEDELPDYEVERDMLKTEVQQWMEKIPKTPKRFENTTKVAWYLLWDLIISPYKNYSRRGILMSKKGMNQIWAWDNCINACAVAQADPELAFDQIRMFFDKQTETGMIPDPINDYQNQYGFTKPPIQGWAILKFIEALGEEATHDFIKEVYTPMVNYTEWWFDFRDMDRNGLCEYNNGVDSGWDNATVFDQGYPVEGPDLAAHLSIQMRALSTMARMLGKQEASEIWAKKADEQIERMVDRCVNADNYIQSPKRGVPLEDVRESGCLLNYVPFELGDKLPERIRTAMIVDLKPGGKFLTEYGLATQHPKSNKYMEDGYWRGPIWSPSTLLIFDGLVKAGEEELAAEIANRFCKLCALDDGFYENYNALTGEGLRDKGYSWTAAGYILMASWLKEYENGNNSRSTR